MLDIVQTYDERVFEEEAEMSALTWTEVHGGGPASARRSAVAAPALRAAVPPGPGHLRLTARGRTVLVVLALMVVGLWSLRGTVAQAGGSDPAVPVTAVTVSAGQTLWQIAAGVAGPDQDVRDVVADLVELNGLDGSGLIAGQQLFVPVGEG